MKPIPLGTRYYKNKSLPASHQNLINLYTEVLDADAKSRLILQGTPGDSVFGTAGSGPLRGMKVMSGVLYVVSDTTLYSVNSAGTGASLGTIPGSGRVGMATNGTQLSITNGTNGYIYTIADGLVIISDADFQPAYTVEYLDGYFLYDETGTGNWFISDLDDGAVYDATEFQATNARPDNVVAVKASQGKVFVFGVESVEPYYNSGQLDFPFTLIKEAVIRKGCIARWSICEFEESLFWLGDDKEVYRMSGLQLERISDNAVSYAINQFTDVSDVRSWCLTWEGHSFYVLSFPTGDQTWAYDLTTGIWFQWQYFNNGSYERHRGDNYVKAYDKHLIGDYANGNIYVLETGTYTNNSQPIRREFTTPIIHNAGQRMYFGEIYIDFETGVGLSTGQGSNPQIMMKMSDDGGRTYGTERWTSIGAIGKYKDKARFQRNGSAYDRSFNVAWTDPVKSTVMGMWYE